MGNDRILMNIDGHNLDFFPQCYITGEGDHTEPCEYMLRSSCYDYAVIPCKAHEHIFRGAAWVQIASCPACGKCGPEGGPATEKSSYVYFGRCADDYHDQFKVRAK